MICRCGHTWDKGGECDYSRNECGPRPSPGIGKGAFKLMLSRNEFANRDILDGGVPMEVISEPVQKEMLRKSRWKFINWIRRITKTEKYESMWVYTVKIK